MRHKILNGSSAFCGQSWQADTHFLEALLEYLVLEFLYISIVILIQMQIVHEDDISNPLELVYILLKPRFHFVWRINNKIFGGHDGLLGHIQKTTGDDDVIGGPHLIYWYLLSKSKK